MPRPKLNYKVKRARAYEKKLPVGEQLDAILKAFDMVLQENGNLPYELIDIIERWQDIKNCYPKD